MGLIWTSGLSCLAVDIQKRPKVSSTRLDQQKIFNSIFYHVRLQFMTTEHFSSRFYVENYIPRANSRTTSTLRILVISKVDTEEGVANSWVTLQEFQMYSIKPLIPSVKV